jgi:hypothetical protein
LPDVFVEQSDQRISKIPVPRFERGKEFVARLGPKPQGKLVSDQLLLFVRVTGEPRETLRVMFGAAGFPSPDAVLLIGLGELQLALSRKIGITGQTAD